MGALSRSRRGINEFDLSDLGTPDTLRYNVLTLIINEEYDRANHHLKDFLNTDSEYPNFRQRTEKYIKHSLELIQAIKSKRDYPGMALLTKTRQAEVREKAREHFQDLKSVLRKVEICQEELRLTDIKSTTILMRTIWLVVVFIAIAAFVKELVDGLGSTFLIIFDQQLGEWIHLFFISVGII